MKTMRTYGLTRNPDYWLIAIVMMLIIAGIILVYSASAWNSYVVSEFTSDTGDLIKHIIRLAIGAVAMIVLSLIDYHTWQDWRIALLVWLVPLGMLGYLWLDNLDAPPGLAKRWFMENVFGNSIQPSEFAKPAIILYISAWLCSKKDKIRDLSEGLVPFTVILGLTAGLILLQPHLSATLVIGLTAVFMFFVAGAEWKHILLLGAAAAALILIMVVSTQYMTDRWGGFMDLVRNPDGAQSGTGQYEDISEAYAQGGPFGTGLGDGQIKHDLKLASTTDLIMTVAGEELGLFGTWMLVALFGLFAWRGFVIAMEAPDQFGALLAVGITFWITLQAVVHALVNARLGPITGMHLPFISYGGSALLTEMAAVGLLINISKSAIRDKEPNHADFAFGWRNGRTRLSSTRRD